jgi:hypothetical protein
MLSRVKRDLIEAISNPIPGFSILISGEDFSEWIIRLTPCKKKRVIDNSVLSQLIFREASAL